MDVAQPTDWHEHGLLTGSLSIFRAVSFFLLPALGLPGAGCLWASPATCSASRLASSRRLRLVPATALTLRPDASGPLVPEGFRRRLPFELSFSPPAESERTAGLWTSCSGRDFAWGPGSLLSALAVAGVPAWYN